MLNTLSNLFNLFRRNQSGAVAVEYALIASVLGIGTVGGIIVLEDEVADYFDTAASHLIAEQVGSQVPVPTVGPGTGGYVPPAPVCTYDPSIPESHPDCVAPARCTYDNSILASDSACVAPAVCVHDNTILASDAACVPPVVTPARCTYDNSLLATDTACVAPVPCATDASILASDPTCLPPSPPIPIITGPCAPFTCLELINNPPVEFKGSANSIPQSASQGFVRVGSWDSENGALDTWGATQDSDGNDFHHFAALFLNPEKMRYISDVQLVHSTELSASSPPRPNSSPNWRLIGIWGSERGVASNGVWDNNWFSLWIKIRESATDRKLLDLQTIATNDSVLPPSPTGYESVGAFDVRGEGWDTDGNRGHNVYGIYAKYEPGTGP